MEKMYKLREACEILRVSKKTIQRWDKQGKIRCIRTPGNHRLVPESEILKIFGFKEPKVQKKEEKKIQEVKKELKPEEIPRDAILNNLSPFSLAQRSAFNELLLATVTLTKFSVSELSSRARCPESVGRMFCEQMVKLGYLHRLDGENFELAVRVIK